MSSPDFDFSVIARAGLTQDEFAKVAGVSRVTTNMWVRGRVMPHRYVADRVKKLISVLKQAVEQNKLPLPSTGVALTKDERAVALKDALVETVKAANTPA